MTMWLEAALIWPTVAIWGHPEYSLALAFGIYGLMASFDGKWFRVGIFMGLALLFQPFTALMLPVIVTRLPARRWIATVAVTALPSSLLLLAPLVKEWHATTFTLFRQPNFPLFDHPTPWLFLAPLIHRNTIGTRDSLAVSAGPGRLLAVLLACVIAVWVAKAKPSLPQVVWWVAASLSLRCVFECVMNPYYLLPGSAIVILLGSRLKSVRLLAISCLVIAYTFMSYWFLSPWLYYSAVVGVSVVALALAWPNERLPSQPELRMERTQIPR